MLQNRGNREISCKKGGKLAKKSVGIELLKKGKICRSLPSVIHALETKSNSFQGSLNRTIYLCAFSHKSSLQLVLTIKSRHAWSVNLLFGETFPESAEMQRIGEWAAFVPFSNLEVLRVPDRTFLDSRQML